MSLLLNKYSGITKHARQTNDMPGCLFPRATSQVAACSGGFDFECLFQIFPITMDNSSSIEHNSLKHRDGTEIHHMMQIGCQIFFTSQLQITTMIPEKAGIEVWLAKFVSVLHPQT